MRLERGREILYALRTMGLRVGLGPSLLALGGAMLLGAAVPARAQSEQPTQPRAVQVRVGAESCPGADALREQLAPLLPEAVVSAPDAPALAEARSVADVRDLGADYEVSVAGVERRWSDAARDCVERARVVAVFVALNVAPPPPPPAEPEPEPPAPAPQRSPWALHLLGSLANAPAPGGTGFGGGLAGSLTLGAWRFELSASALSPVELALDATSTSAGAVRLTRVPFALGLAYLLRAGAFAAGPQLGVVLDLLQLRGVDLEREQSQLRLNPGLGGGVLMQLEMGEAWLALARFTVEVFPRQYALIVAPAGEQGQTPSLWLRLEVGVGFRLP